MQGHVPALMIPYLKPREGLVHRYFSGYYQGPVYPLPPLMGPFRLFHLLRRRAPGSPSLAYQAFYSMTMFLDGTLRVG